MAPTNFNTRHPELRPGESFYVNGRKGFLDLLLEKLKKDFPLVQWRVGETAYTPSGKVVEGNVPIFQKPV